MVAYWTTVAFFPRQLTSYVCITYLSCNLQTLKLVVFMKGLDSSFISETSNLGLKLLSRVLREPIRMSRRSPTRLLSRTWSKHQESRRSVEEIFASETSEESRTRWFRFSGSQGKKQLRRWIGSNRLYVGQKDEQSMFFSEFTPYWEAMEEGQYLIPPVSLMLF